MVRFQLAQGQSHFKEAVYFLRLSFQRFLVLILSTSEGCPAALALEPPSGFEFGIPGLGSSTLATRSFLMLINLEIYKTKRNRSLHHFQRHFFGCPQLSFWVWMQHHIMDLILHHIMDLNLLLSRNPISADYIQQDRVIPVKHK